jgi:hypothetical protein
MEKKKWIVGMTAVKAFFVVAVTFPFTSTPLGYAN